MARRKLDQYMVAQLGDLPFSKVRRPRCLLER
jgi:hypothetical protein